MRDRGRAVKEVTRSIAPTNAQLQDQINQIRIDNEQSRSDHQDKFEMILNAIMEDKKTTRQLQTVLRSNRETLRQLQDSNSELQDSNSELQEENSQLKEKLAQTEAQAQKESNGYERDRIGMRRRMFLLGALLRKRELEGSLQKTTDPDRIQWLKRFLADLQDQRIGEEARWERQLRDLGEGEGENDEDTGNKSEPDEKEHEEVSDGEDKFEDGEGSGEQTDSDDEVEE